MSKVKKYLVILLMITVSGLSVYLPIYIWPKEIHEEYEAVMFRAGEADYEESVQVEVAGHVNNRIFGGKKFLGKILIDKMPLREGFRDQTIQVKFNKKGLGMMVFLDDSKGENNLLLIPEAYIAMSKKGDEIAISFLEDGDTATHMFDGSLMIAGPATDRGQAVEKANELMDEVLDIPLT